MQASKPSYFTGKEEVVARLLSLIFSITFFSIYILSIGQITLEWDTLLLHIFIFWLIYELLSAGMYIILSQFSQNNKNKNNYSMDKKVEPKIITDNKSKDKETKL